MRRQTTMRRAIGAGDLELAGADAACRLAAEGERAALAKDRAAVAIHRLGEGEDARRGALERRLQAGARLDPEPAAGDHAAAILGAERRHDAVGGVVAPGEARSLAGAQRCEQAVEDVGQRRRIGGQVEVGDEGAHGAVRLRTLEAVDGAGIIAEPVRRRWMPARRAWGRS